MLFDWLVVGHSLDVNPAHAVRGPTHRVKKGKTPVLMAAEARILLDSIQVVKIVISLMARTPTRPASWGAAIGRSSR